MKTVLVLLMCVASVAAAKKPRPVGDWIPGTVVGLEQSFNVVVVGSSNTYTVQTANAIYTVRQTAIGNPKGFLYVHAVPPAILANKGEPVEIQIDGPAALVRTSTAQAKMRILKMVQK
jgi:hypothetical protein